ERRGGALDGVLGRLQATTRLAMHGSVLDQHGKAERLEAAEVPASVAGSDIEGPQVPTARLPDRAVGESSVSVGRCGRIRAQSPASPSGPSAHRVVTSTPPPSTIIVCSVWATIPRPTSSRDSYVMIRPERRSRPRYAGAFASSACAHRSENGRVRKLFWMFWR